MEHHGRTDANANAIAPPAPVATTVRCIADFLEKLEPAGAGNDGARSRSAAMSWWRRRSACATPATGMAATAPGALPSPRRRWLGLGDRFHVVGFSRGGQIVWSCLAHIPHRLAGAVLVSPLANFWWRGFPGGVSSRAFAAQLAQDRWAVSVARHAPWLVYWWNTQRWFPPFSLIARDRRVYSPPDMDVISKLAAGPRRRPYRAEVKQQGVFEALHRDMIMAFGEWDYSPLELGEKEVAVHLWHGADDRVVTPTMSRHIARQLPWIRYHEVPDAGHLFILADGMADRIVKTLVLGD